MEQNLYLYQGKDYWLIPRLKNKEIIMKNVQTQLEHRIPFLTKTAVRVNYYSWLENQEIRLPNTFLIIASEYDRDMKRAFEKLNINAPKKSDLKNMILFHKGKNSYIYIHLEDINDTLIPTIHYKDIYKVISHISNQVNKHVVELVKRPGKGLFADQVY